MIYLIRHGETEFNVARRFQGGLDSPLTTRGAAQARAMGKTLRNLIDPQNVALFSSPRGRALQTAGYIAEEAGIASAPIIDDGLAEISLGSWDGKTGAEVDRETNGGWSKLASNSWHFQTPDGERYEGFEARLAAALQRVADHTAAVRVVVSHGVASRVLRKLHASLPQEEAFNLTVPQGVIYRLDPGAIVEIDCTAAIV
jgi:broad specificity phosphatase PhoE